MNRAAELLSTLPLGTRVVVRYRIDGGATDALGELAARDVLGVSVATRSGNIAIGYDEILLSKPVPPPPPRRERRIP